MLKKETVNQINDLVHTKPRSIAEVARHIKVNWRTANRYIQKIEKEEGIISTRVFREGTPGALKIVFWNNIEKLHASEIQERLFKQIEFGRKKTDFSPSEIYQFVDEKKKIMKVMNRKEYNSKENFNTFVDELKSAEKQLLFLSGNLTFSNLASHDKTIRSVMEDLGKEKITSKILTSVDFAGIKNVQNMLAINKRVGYTAVEVRHCYQPLRATIIDDKEMSFKEVLDPKDYSKGELKEKLFIVYFIKDEKWISWMKKVFWHLFRGSIDAKKRIEELELF